MRRRALPSLILAATLLLAACGGSNDQPTPTINPGQGSFVTATAAPPTQSPIPTPTPDPQDAIRVLHFAPGEPIEDIEQGAFFVDTRTGAVEVVVSTANVNGFGYQVSPGNRWVLASTRTGSVLYDRVAGRVILSEELAADAYETPTLYLLDSFIIIDAGTQPPDRADREFVVRDAELNEVSRFGLDEGRVLGGSLSFRQSLGGEHALLKTNINDEYRIIELDSGAILELEGGPVPTSVQTAQITQDGILFRTESRLTNEQDPRPCEIRRFAWSGKLIESSEFEDCSTSPWRGLPDFSPDGRLAIIPRDLAVQEIGALGGNPRLGGLYVYATDSGQALFRVTGAILPRGDATSNTHWLSDGSGFVVETLAGFRLVSSTGEWLPTALPQNLPWSQWPIPSPDDPDIFSLGRGGGVFNTETGDTLAVNLDDPPGHVDPWGATGDEIRFVLPHGGHDGASAIPVVAPAIQFPPFVERAALQVFGSETCLNVRVEPSTESEIVTCISDGTAVYPAPVPDLNGETVSDKDSGAVRPALVTNVWRWVDSCESVSCVWVSVETPSGQTGWAAAEYLRWPGTHPPEAD